MDKFNKEVNQAIKELADKIPWYKKYHSGKTLTENQEKLLSKFASQKDLESEIPLELLYGPTKVTVKQVASWLEFKEEHQRWPTYEEAFVNKPLPPHENSEFPNYQHKAGWDMPEFPPVNKPSPPEPPKPRCIADERNTALESAKQITSYMKWFSGVAGILLIANLYTANKISDMKIDPKRTDHAVQAGIRECERTLPRTQTCELSQMSFKVVEKKQW